MLAQEEYVGSACVEEDGDGRCGLLPAHVGVAQTGGRGVLGS